MASSRKPTKPEVVVASGAPAKTESTSPDVFMSKYDQISEEKFAELQRRIEIIESVLRANPKNNFDKLAAKVAE